MDYRYCRGALGTRTIISPTTIARSYRRCTLYIAHLFNLHPRIVKLIKADLHNLWTIGGKTITWSERVKYLGCYFRCNTGEVDPVCFVGKFYGSFNNIINVLGSKRDEMLTVHLVKTYCLPSLLYGCEIWNLNTSDARSVDVAWTMCSKNI